ncbi:MAG: ABC transporter permease [Gammaproteobacteria bacterium]|nr:ABC transporter permease [Gammaproteobacteria bacterium]
MSLPLKSAPVWLGLAVLVSWQWFGGAINANILPPPSAIAQSLVNDTALWWPHLLTTLWVTALGFAIAIVLSIGVSAILDASPLLKRALYPWLFISQMVPIIFIYPLLIMGLGFGYGPKILVVVLVCFFPTCIALTDGLAATPHSWMQLFKTYRASAWQTFWRLRWPAALPQFFTGLKVSATYSVMGAVIGEWMGAQSGLGVYMLRAYKSFNSTRVFGAVVLVIFTSLLAVGIVRLLQQRYGAHHS